MSWLKVSTIGAICRLQGQEYGQKTGFIRRGAAAVGRQGFPTMTNGNVYNV